METKEETYKVETRCKVCSAMSADGVPLRDEVDAMVAKGCTYVQVINWLGERGIHVKKLGLMRHITRHSPFVKKAKMLQTRKALSLQGKIENELRNANTALERIISVGDQMVENWVDDLPGPKLPIDRQLYMDAIREQGRREKLAALDKALDELDRDWIEGEVVRDTTKELPVETQKDEKEPSGGITAESI